MRHRRVAWFCLSGIIGLALLTDWSARSGRAQEAKPPAAEAVKPAAPAEAMPTGAEAKVAGEADAKAVAVAPAPAGPGDSPTKPDPTGAYVDGADVSGKSTKTDGKVTPADVAKDVHLLKISINILWAMIAGFLVMFMQAGFRPGRDRPDSGQERRPHDGDELHGLRGSACSASGSAGSPSGSANYGAIAYFDGPEILNQKWSCSSWAVSPSRSWARPGSS